MSGRKVVINVDAICNEDSGDGLRSYSGVFSGRVDMLASRADILNGRDRAIMKMYLKNGLTFRQMAQIAGTTEGVIARKIHKLTSRLTKGEYIKCIRNRDRFGRTEMDVARDYFLDGLSQRRIAKKRRMSLYSTRKLLLKIQKIISELP